MAPHNRRGIEQMFVSPGRSPLLLTARRDAGVPDLSIWLAVNRRLILASGSLARRQLLEWAGLSPEVAVSHVSEDGVDHLPAIDAVLVLAERKARAVAEAERAEPAGDPPIVIGCDSMLEFDGETWGKPSSPAQVIQRWRRLRGREGRLHTGHCVIDTSSNRTAGATDTAVVRFGVPDDREIEAYSRDEGGPRGRRTLHARGAVGPLDRIDRRQLRDHNGYLAGPATTSPRRGERGDNRPVVLKIGPIEVDPPVVLAPMAGVTNPAFRQLCRSFGPALYVSEMITARALVERNEKTLRMVARAPGETTHSVQLYGVDPAVVAAAVRILVDEIGVDHVDLNFGCPAPKVTRKGGGAALPAHPVLYRGIVAAAVRAAGAVPVTVKMRMGLDRSQPDGPASRLDRRGGGGGRRSPPRPHGRAALRGTGGMGGHSRAQRGGHLRPHLGQRRHLGSRRRPRHARTDRLRRRGDRPGLSGPAVDLRRAGRHPVPGDDGSTRAIHSRPGPASRLCVRVMSDHARLLAAYLGEPAGLRDFRKHTGWYLTGFPVGGEIRRRLASVASLAELDDLLARLDPDIPLPESARRLPRGHTDGPRPVTLPVWMARDPR